MATSTIPAFCQVENQQDAGLNAEKTKTKTIVIEPRSEKNKILKAIELSSLRYKHYNRLSKNSQSPEDWKLLDGIGDTSRTIEIIDLDFLEYKVMITDIVELYEKKAQLLNN